MGIESVNKIPVSLSLIGQFWGTSYMVFRLSPVRPNLGCPTLLDLLASLSYFPTSSFLHLCFLELPAHKSLPQGFNCSLHLFMFSFFFLLILDFMVQGFIHFLNIPSIPFPFPVFVILAWTNLDLCLIWILDYCLSLSLIYYDKSGRIYNLLTCLSVCCSLLESKHHEVRNFCQFYFCIHST